MAVEKRFPRNQVGCVVGEETRLVAMKKRFKPIGKREIEQLKAQGYTEDNLPIKENVVYVPVNKDTPLDHYLRKGMRPVDPRVLGSDLIDANDIPAALREQIFAEGRAEAMAELGENMPEPKTCPDCEQAFFAKLPQQIYCDPCRTVRKAKKGAKPKMEPVAVAE